MKYASPRLKSRAAVVHAVTIARAVVKTAMRVRARWQVWHGEGSDQRETRRVRAAKSHMLRSTNRSACAVHRPSLRESLIIRQVPRVKGTKGAGNAQKGLQRVRNPTVRQTAWRQEKYVM